MKLRRFLAASLFPGLVASIHAADLTTSEEIQQLYIAYLGRPADGPGLDYWTEQVDLGNISLEQIRVNLVNEQPEYLENYGQLETIDLVETVYVNLFNRESDIAGRDYWVGQLESGAFFSDQLIVAFINGAAEPDRIVLQNKVAIADCYTEQGQYTYRQVIQALGEATNDSVLTDCPLAPAVPFALNDTGSDLCVSESDSVNLVDCVDTSYPQDAVTGRDYTHNDDSDGRGGFSFTKLDENGNALSASASDWACVRDNVTGLVWDARSNEPGLHYKGNTYDWYNPDPATNGGDAGSQTPDGIFTACTGSECNTHALITALNSKRYCGHNLWRLPNVMELLSLADVSSPTTPIDTNFFRFPDESYLRSIWTSQTSPESPSDAYYVIFESTYGSVGSIRSWFKESDEVVMPVSD